MSPSRALLLERYRDTECDIFDGRWQPWTCVPDRELLVVSAWNPHARAADPAENERHDRRLYRYLRRRHTFPLRVRGRSAQGETEQGWMVPHRVEESLETLREFGQSAGMILGPKSRKVLWDDGTVDELVSDLSVPSSLPANCSLPIPDIV